MLDEAGNPVVEGEPADTTEAPSEPSPLMETLLERGVEIISALAFVFLLMKSLRPPKKTDGEEETTEEDEPEVDPELLAHMRIEHLLDNEPEQVGRILTEWVREENEAMARNG